MTRHSFKYSKEFLSELREKIQNAFLGLQPERFGQEPNYTSALLGRPHGIEVKSRYGEYARIKATNIDDRGPGSAESRYGADFAITATVGDSKRKIRKAILVQVKNQPIDTLTPSQKKDLKKQINKMKAVVSSPKVAGIRRNRGSAMLEVSSASLLNSGKAFQNA